MEDLIKHDIFFFTTSVAVVVVTIFVVIALWYLIRILKNVKDVSKMVKDGSEDVYGDLSTLRSRMKRFFKFTTKTHKKNNKK